MRRLFVDVETTGLNPAEGDRIVEVAAVAYDGDSKVEGDGACFHHYVNPERDIAADVVKIHGLTAARLANEPRFGEIAAELADFLRGSELVAHNAEFDIAFLDMELRAAGQPAVRQLVDKVVDTLAIANENFPQQRNNLSALGSRLNLDVQARRQRHGALVDAELLADIYHLMHSGQSDLDLHQDAMASSLKMPQGEISIVVLPPSEAVARAHAQYLQGMQEETGVRPVALDPA